MIIGISGGILLFTPLGMAYFAQDAYSTSLPFLKIMAAIGSALIFSQIPNPGFIKVHFPGVESVGVAAIAIFILIAPIWNNIVKSDAEESIVPPPSAEAPDIEAVKPQTLDIIAIDACVAEKITLFQSEKKVSTEGAARVGGPGYKGGTKRAYQDICLELGPNQEFISAFTKNLICHGDRCKVTAPINNKGRVCVTVEAWSASKSYGGGGNGKYRLTANYRDIATDEDRELFRTQCMNYVNKSISQ